MNRPRVVASVEARMGSSRLPGKMLSDVCGKPAVERLMDRLARCCLLDEVVLATTISEADDALAAWAGAKGVMCFRGSEEDVLDRVVKAQRMCGGEVVVEVTGDCTLLDPELVDMGVATFFANPCDVVTNVRQLSFPMGMDIQVFRLSELERVAAAVDDRAVREHVSLYFYEHEERYRIIHLMAPARWHAPAYRFQLDYPEDLAFIRLIYTALEPEFGPAFGIEEIMHYLRLHPELTDINIHCEEKAPR